MKKFAIKSLSIVLALLMLVSAFSITAFAADDEAEETVPKTGLDAVPEDQKLITTQGDLQLYASMKTGEFSIYNKASGYLWTHGIDKNQYEVKVGGTWGKRTSSILEIRHFDKVSKEATTKSAFAPQDCSKVTVNKVQNGIECVYEFKNIGLSATAIITLDENGLSVKVPADKISEGDERGFVAVAILPGFGAGGQGEQGYVVYPDGSGGLTDFTKRNERPKSISEETFNIYGIDSVDIDKYLEIIEDETQVASLPMFGIVKDNNGLLAMIEDGDDDAMIRLQVAGYPATLDMYRCFFEFTYRHVYSQYMSNITINGANKADNPTMQRIDIAMEPTDKAVRYVLVSGEEANYAGIASAYRETLLESGALVDKIEAGDDIPLGIDFFIGIMEDMGIYEAQTVVTTFDNCITILEALKEAGVEDIETILKGWEKDGYDALPNVSVNSKAGGKRGLIKLADFAKENNISLALFTNLMFGYEENGGFSLKNDILYNGADIPVTSKAHDETFILTPMFSAENHAKLLKNISSADGVGVAYKNITKYLYFDYHDIREISRGESVELWQGLFKEVAEQGRTVAVEYGGLFSLKYADRIFDIPIRSTRKYTCDSDIPLVQLVLHGVIPYSAESLNLSSDLVETKLKWVEYGCMPNFELTYESSSLLKKTAYNKLFSSQYEKWLDMAVEIYEEFNENLGDLWGLSITGHTILKEDLVRVEYENGTVIYINYTKHPEFVDNVAIPAQDYAVVR